MSRDRDWQNDFMEIKSRGLHLLHTEKWSDCRFLVGTPPNQKIIAGHKLILAMASPVFERMFFGQLADESDPIVIPDVQSEAFQAMMEYMYSDNIKIRSFDKACELCYVAKKYMLPHVVEQCTQYLWHDLSPKNACRAYEFAKLFDEPRLMQSSMEMIAGNTREVLADPSFTDIELSTMMAILDQDKLDIDSELDLFNALVRFANERAVSSDESFHSANGQSDDNSASGGGVLHVEEIKMEPDVNAMVQGHEEEFNDSNNTNSFHHDNPASPDVVVVDSDDSLAGISEAGQAVHATNEQPSTSAVGQAIAAPAVDNINYYMDTQRSIIDEAMLRQAVKKIRFLTMTPQQFAEGPARSKLLEQNEALAILIKISSPSFNDSAMPEGFCSSRISRNLASYRHPLPAPASGNICRFAPNDPSMDHAPSQVLGSFRNFKQTRANAGHLAVHAFDAENGINDTRRPTDHNPSHELGTTRSLQITGVNDFATRANAGLPTIPAVDADVATNDTRRSYCVRTVNPQFDYRNTSVTDCGVTFQVDTNIWIKGVQVPTQVLCGELMNSAGFSDRYSEILYAHLQDIQGSRLSYTHCTSRVRYDSLLEISFDRPVYIFRNQIYKVFVVFNKVGWYPMYNSMPDVVANNVKFVFNVGDPNESVRDGLIRAIVFSKPQEHNRPSAFKMDEWNEEQYL